MRLSPSDPDIATLYRRIIQSRLDLQPNFQRGEVWGRGKKQRLIDSILRGWHIPPVHVIQVPGTEKQEVLDGQQRLAAIRDFIAGKFPINGEQPPTEQTILNLDGMYWDDLPPGVRSKIEDFTIRILTISDYLPGEPGELFYRLNQPTNLTSAEQRNAYFGEARQQVKSLTDYMMELGFSSELIGFSNSRMAYDDVLAKFLLTLEMETLTSKHTANSVTARYRESTGFDHDLEKAVQNCLKKLLNCISNRETSTKLNKATIFTWLVFIYTAGRRKISPSLLITFFNYFETLREAPEVIPKATDIPRGITRLRLAQTIETYQDRASSRVADISSVVFRDIILWGVLVVKFPEIAKRDKYLNELYLRIHPLLSGGSREPVELALHRIVMELNWGDTLC